MHAAGTCARDSTSRAYEQTIAASVKYIREHHLCMHIAHVPYEWPIKRYDNKGDETYENNSTARRWHGYISHI